MLRQPPGPLDACSGFLRIAALLACTCGFAVWAAAAEPLESLLARAMHLAGQKNFAAAESVSREAVARWPESNDAWRTLGNVLLWQAEYGDAREIFTSLLSRDPRDVESRLGLARSHYWAGDSRGALREFSKVLDLRPNDAEARRAVEEIRAAMRPGYAVDAALLDDDQPYRAAGGRVRAFFFSDPLTTWELDVEGAGLDAGDEDETAARAGAAVETMFTAIRMRVRAGVSHFRFPDGSSELLPSLRIARRLATTTLELSAESRPLLRSAAALATHPSADVFTLRWSREETGRVQFAARGEHLRYFDGNRGWGADGYLLVTAFHAADATVSAGGSIAYRDTDESRFRLADPLTLEGIYDPYWTPRELLEGRLIVAASLPAGAFTFSVHLDGGVARDRARSFSPPSSTVEYDRTFHPWRASVTSSVQPSSALTLSLSFAHETTVDYDSNEIRASLAGRF